MHEFDKLDGAILIDKPAGPTSHDVVDAVRRNFSLKKVGHCGTLDPGATGLLILVLGRGTKLSEKLMSDDKVYEGCAKFGESTDSYDADGEMVASLPVPPMTLEEINEAAAAFQGDQMQMPPMVSAVKIKGVPLYKMARKGVEVERKPRLIHVYSFRFTRYESRWAGSASPAPRGPTSAPWSMNWARRPARGAHLASLRRVISGKFDVKDSIPFEDALKLTSVELEKRVLPFLQLTLPHATP